MVGNNTAPNGNIAVATTAKPSSAARCGHADRSKIFERWA
jgi:hypothetical protein